MQLKLFQLALWILLFGAVGLASTREGVIQLQQTLENRITPIAKTIDPQSLVYIRIHYKKKNISLPGTPFVVQNLALQDAAGAIEILNIDITVLTEKDSFPRATLNLISEITSSAGPVNVHVRKLPEELQSKLSHEIQQPIKAPSFFSDLIEKWKKDSVTDQLRIVLEIVLSVVFVMLLTLLAGLSWKVPKVLKTGFRSVSNAVESSMQERSSDSLKAKPAPSSASENRIVAANLTSTPEQNEIFRTLPTEGLVALLADCYWSLKDSYATHVWKRIPVDKRTSIIEKHKFLSEYAVFLRSVTEENLGWEQDPYYLSPLPINHLDNRILTDVVRQAPYLIHWISSMRLNNLHLGAREKIEMTRKGLISEGATSPNFKKMPPSPLRQLQLRIEIPIISVREEKEVLAIPELSVDLMATIPSLGWLLKVPKKQLAPMLDSFSARELAEAWIGPKEVLANLAGLLPDKKRMLLESYREKIRPSRQAPAFQALHKACVDYLRKPKQMKHMKHKKTRLPNLMAA